MTAVLATDGVDFSLRCDGCGLIVGSLGTVLHRWDLAWSLLRRYGWVGERSASGPHGCPRCVRRGASVLHDDLVEPPAPAGRPTHRG